MPFKIFLSSFHPTFLPRILTILNRNFWEAGLKIGNSTMEGSLTVSNNFNVRILKSRKNISQCLILEKYAARAP